MRNGTGIRTAVRVAMVLFLAGAVARGQAPQEPSPANPATDTPTSQATKADAEPTTEVSVQDTGNTGPPDCKVFAQETLQCIPGIDIATAGNVVIQKVNRVLNVAESRKPRRVPTTRKRSAYLSAKPGTRIQLFASPGFPLARLNVAASQIVEHANRANIAINAIDARGLYAPEPGGDISQPSMDLPSAAGLKASLRLAEQHDQRFVLMDFAFGTGGTFFHLNDIEGGLKPLGSVPDISYVLGFSPQNQKMDGRYHRRSQ